MKSLLQFVIQILGLLKPSLACCDQYASNSPGFPESSLYSSSYLNFYWHSTFDESTFSLHFENR